MKKILIISTLFSIIIFISLILILNFFLNNKKSTIVINNKTFYVDVARSDLEHEKGLSVYNNIPENKAMIFIFNTDDYYAFWMKDMKFAIDIIYIKNNRIVDLFQNVTPPKLSTDRLNVIRPKEKADMVLEINANLSSKYHLKIGDSIKTNI